MIFYILFTISVKSDRCLYDLFIMPRCIFYIILFQTLIEFTKLPGLSDYFQKIKMVCDLFFCSSLVPNDRLKL